MPNLSSELKIAPGQVVGFVGAGGKTTTLMRLLAELRAEGRTVLTTSTVHMFELKGVAPHPFVVESDAARLRATLPELLAQHGHVRVAGERLRADKIRGLDPATVASLADLPGLDNLLVECDGARHRSLKAPSEREPVLPAHLDLLLVVAGLDIINRELNEETVHRQEQVQAITGLQEGELIDTLAVAKVVTSSDGGLKGVSPDTRVWVILTKWIPDTAAVGEELAMEILAQAGGRIEGVVLLGPAQVGRLSEGEVRVFR